MHHVQIARRTALAAFVALLALAAVSANAERFLLYSTGEVIPEKQNKAVNFAAPDDTLVTNGITFRIVYEDAPGVGFRNAALGASRQARWKNALTYIASVLNETGTVNILVAPSINLNDSLLASCGTFYSCGLPHIQAGAFMDRLRGVPGGANDPDAQLEVNWFHNYNLTAGPPNVDQIDLITLLIHEATHALGIASLMSGTGASQLPCETYTTHDALIVRDTGNFPMLDNSPPLFQGLVGDLTGNDLAFGGASATAQFGSRPPIFSPNTFFLGSSIGHWDTGLIIGGAVMEPSLADGEMLRVYRTFELGALKDIGWANVNVVAGPDLVPPVITRIGAPTVTHECGDPYTDLGATAQDNVDGNITAQIVTGGAVINANTNPGTFQITYNVMDAAGNPATTVTRNVTVQDTTQPNIVLTGAGISLDCDATITDPGVNATDDCDGVVAVSTNAAGVDLTTAGTYQLVYTATDSSGNTAMATRAVTVSGPTCVTPPPTGCGGCANPDKANEPVDASLFLGDFAAIGLMMSALVAARRRRQ